MEKKNRKKETYLLEGGGRSLGKGDRSLATTGRVLYEELQKGELGISTRHQAGAVRRRGNFVDKKKWAKGSNGEGAPTRDREKKEGGESRRAKRRKREGRGKPMGKGSEAKFAGIVCIPELRKKEYYSPGKTFLCV